MPRAYYQCPSCRDRFSWKYSGAMSEPPAVQCENHVGQPVDMVFLGCGDAGRTAAGLPENSFTDHEAAEIAAHGAKALDLPTRAMQEPLATDESFAEQLSRIELMAEGDPTWDLSDNDTAALKAVLDRLKERIQS